MKRLATPLFPNLPKSIPTCETVGELVAQLQKLPPELPVGEGGGGVTPIVFNANYDTVHLELMEDDDTWGAAEDEDDDDA